MWIEVFRTGTWTDSSGNTRTWTEEDLDRIVETYNPREHEAPVVIGHPKDNAPAYGWVEALKRSGDRLLAKIKPTVKEFVDWIRQGLYKKVSISLYPDLSLRHVGFLGANPPAVKGLNPEGLPVPEFKEGPFDEYTLDFASSVRLNRKGVSHARRLISQGKVDTRSSWSISADDENRILGDPPDWQEYGKWFLGVDPDADPETKAHYKYPFGKNGKVYRSALIAIRQRAAQQGAEEIFDAAGRLLELIDNKDMSEEGNGMEDKIKELEARIEEREKQYRELELKFQEGEERRKKAEEELKRLQLQMRKMEFEQFLNEQIAFGTLTPAQQDKAMQILMALDSLNFGQDDRGAVGLFMEFIKELPRQVEMKEYATKDRAGDVEGFSFSTSGRAVVDTERLELHKKVLSLSREKNISYTEALHYILNEREGK